MSIPNLPVNFKDDILAASNPKRKYQQTFNSDGSVSLEDVTVYTQQGSDFGASQVNQTNGAINNIYNERILDLDELELVTEPGFFVDAKAVKESYDELNGKMPFIQHGREDVGNVNGASSYTKNITFDVPFASRPNISASAYVAPGNPGSFEIGVTSISETGFSARITNRAQNAYFSAIEWIAIGEKSVG